MIGSTLLTLWVRRVAGWDGLLPAFVWGLSALVAVIFPRIWGVSEILSVALPIVAFLIRLRVGWQAIHTNDCGLWIRSIQSIAFGVGIVILCVLDAFIILSQSLPRGGLTAKDWITAGILYAIYLLMMTIAMYPGRPLESVLKDPSPR